ncbi:MAG: nickel-dependent lactate racemase [Tindallia sp. MSAO_Bac2]|nr:MAG: nickel-dependent lactate racemase [Tindallia sp. MSAO_Bac2]
MDFELNFAKGKASFQLDESLLMGVLKPNEIAIESEGVEEVKKALKNPIGTGRLNEVLNPGESVAIITSDITRPMPSKVVLPSLLEELNEAGIEDEDIKIIFALGSHRKHTEEEIKALVGDAVYDRIQCLDLDVEDCVELGKSRRGTPMNIYRPVVEADRRICLGNIEYHYFAGYSGGSKAIMPGVATRDSIQANHSMMVLDEATTGSLDENPLRQDIEEITNFVSIDFILNVVLNESKQIIKAVAGHHKEAHRAGCDFLDKLYKIELEEAADLVIVSPGGYPKDINLYQAQKALDNAKHAVRDGGVIILVASCKEGLGEGVFERWMLESVESKDMITRIKQHFELGGHKAAAIALVLEKADVYLVSDLEDDFVRSIFLEPCPTVNAAVQKAKNKLGQNFRTILMPYGGSTLPVVKG